MPPTQRLRYLSLDAWRGIACLLVVLYHSAFYINDNPDVAKPTHGLLGLAFGLFDRGRLGVPLFFVISGYCIAAASVGTKASVGRFFVRRFRRIYPPAWVCILATIALFLVVTHVGFPLAFEDAVDPIPGPGTLTLWQWIGNITLTETWRGHLVGPPGTLFLNHYWSLCFEEQFYAICGLALLLGRSATRFFLSLLLITIAVAIVFVIRLPYRQTSYDGWFFDGHWLMFAAGVAVYWRIHHASVVGRRVVELVLLVGTVLAVLVSRQNMLAVHLRTSLAFALGLCYLWKYDARIAASPLVRPISWSGVMCYSWYLTHYPVCKLVSHGMYSAGLQTPRSTLLLTLPACVAVSLLVARIFHVLVERRFLNPPAPKSGDEPAPMSPAAA